MTEWPQTPFPPSHIHILGKRIIVVGVDGDFVFLDSSTLVSTSDSARPFPSSVQYSTVVDGLLIGTWTEYELKIARMAALRTDVELSEGVDKAELRTGSEHEVPKVAGAIWSHALESEPLAMTSEGERIAFCTYKGGIYCISPNSTELWRQPLVEWPKLSKFPDGSHIVGIASAPDPNDASVQRIWVWGAAGGWAIYSWEDGDLLDQGSLEVKLHLESVWGSEDGEWLLGFPPDNVARWRHGGEIEVATVNGPINDALWDEKGWSMTDWREDLRWGSDGIQQASRPEIGMSIYEHRKQGKLILDNTGNWSRFQF